MSHRRFRWLAVGVLFGTISLGATSLRAGEPFQAFIDGLRDRNLYDSALDYLVEMRTSTLLTNEQKTMIPYEEGRTLIDQARNERDGNQKAKQLDLARDKLQEFVKANGYSPLVGAASMQLGNVIVERGRMALESSGRPSQLQNKEVLVKQARDYFQQSQKVFDEAEKKFEEKLAAFPKFIDPKDTKQIEDRDQARRDSIQSQLYAAAVLYETAKTYPDNSADAKKALQTAADKYQKTYERYRTRLAGLLARIKQGQCYQDMGDRRRALGLYADILGQPDDLEEFRKLKASALYLSMQCWTDPDEKKFELAAIKGEEWLVKARGLEDRQPDWLAVRYYTALAHKQTADDQKDPGQKKNELNKARDNANQVARLPGAYQDMAKSLIKQITGNEGLDKEPTNFVDALERGKSLLDEMTAKLTQIKIAPTMKNEQQIPQLQKEADEARQKAIEMFHLALALRDDANPQEEVNNVRYYLCFLDYQSGNFYDAAVLGEFLATKYPSSAGARQGAKIALASYLQGYNDKAPEMVASRDFDRQRMESIVEYIGKRWKDEAEADDAWAILMAVAIGEHNLAKAKEYLAKIPEKSPRRADSELKAGQAYWAAYLTAQRKEGAERPPQSELDDLVKQAQGLLEQGMARMRANVDAGARVTLDLAAAALSASQIYVGAGDPQQAVKLLEDPKIGPLTLVTAKDPVVQQADFPVETYKVALRAFVGIQGLDRAEKIMSELDEMVAAKGVAGQSELTKIYISLGRGLEEQVTELRRAGKTEELKKVSKGFELFLQRISERENGNNFSSLNWVSETFFSLGSGYDTPGKKVPPEALAYYEKTLATDKKMIANATKDKTFLPSPDAMVAVQLRTARCLRRMDKFKDAVDLLVSILMQKPQLLDAQTEAALTYMDWGQENPAYYNLAMLGARKIPPSEVKIIWGWSRLSNMVQGDKKYQDVYHEARWNLANCNLLMAQAKAGAERTELLKKAAFDIYITQRLKPDLGGDVWRDKYDSLLKTIQKLAGEKPVGLKAMQTPAAGETKTTQASAS
jgi:hypothetical protein